MTHTTAESSAPEREAIPPPLQALPLMEPEEWRAQYASHVFRSNESLRWFIRQHSAELIQSGAICSPARQQLVHPELFGRAVMSIGQRLAAMRAKLPGPHDLAQQ